MAERRQAEWLNICPWSMQNTIAKQIPDQAGLRRVMAHSFKERRGLFLTGGTGLGKSRAAWMKLEREHQAGRSIAVLSSGSALDYAGLFGNGAEAAVTWAEKMSSSDILFMDDVFKCKLTDSFEGAIFAIVDRRTEQGKPVVVTCNDSPGSLKVRMSADRGEPLLRRLCEFCDVVKFEGNK